jgi:hypothetical protein
MSVEQGTTWPLHRTSLNPARPVRPQQRRSMQAHCGATREAAGSIVSQQFGGKQLLAAVVKRVQLFDLPITDSCGLTSSACSCRPT